MATYASYTPEQQAIVQNTVNLVRAAAGEMARIFNKLKAIKDDTNAVGLVTGLDVGQLVPNSSGLAGSDSLNRTEIVNLYNLLDGIRNTNDTTANRNAISKAAGINNTLGV